MVLSYNENFLLSISFLKKLPPLKRFTRCNVEYMGLGVMQRALATVLADYRNGSAISITYRLFQK